MNRKCIFPKHKNIYKGNLHSHTTRSDGAYSAETVIEGYKARGYQFLCLSDHHNYYDRSDSNCDNFIILHGMEGGVGYSRFHLHAVADYSIEVEKRITADSEYPIDEALTVQETIDEYQKQGNLCIINHPRWSGLEYDDLMGAEGYLGIEVYNHNCECESLTGTATDYLDYALQRGKRLYAFASDDAHAEDMYKKISEFFGGWICVSADELTHVGIVNSIRNGDFYAANGPEIIRIEQLGTEIYVKTSPVRSIAFNTFPEHGYNAYSKDGNPISEATYRLLDGTRYVRIEITDFAGKKAWSNPIFFDE